MFEDLVFLTCYDKGVTRAWCGPEGRWTVDKTLNNLAVTCLGEDPASPNVIYAGTYEDGVMRSSDMGKSWEPLGLKGQVIKSLAVSPHDPDVIFAGSKPALLFRSTDGGRSWEDLEGFRAIPNRWWWFSPAEPPDRRPYVISIAISPTEADVVLAGVEFGAVVRSSDGGQTWSRHLRGALRDCHSLKFHQTNGNWTYEAGGSGGGASLSRDGGLTWSKQGSGLAAHYGIVCAADPVRPEVWYVCVGKSPFNAFGDQPDVFLYRSSGGAGWDPIGWATHPLHETPTTLVTLPGRGGEIFAGLKTGDVYHSPDHGENWQQLPFNLGGIWHSLSVLETR